MEDNIEGTVNILEAARRGVKRIIFFFFGRRLREYCSEVPSVKQTRSASIFTDCLKWPEVYPPYQAYGLSYVIFRFANVAAGSEAALEEKAAA